MNIALFGRHPPPKTHSSYHSIIWPEGIPDDKMADYDYMNTVCFMWVNDNDKSIASTNAVYLYVEGFTPALISFLKAWEVMYFRYGRAPTLWLMHYQPDGTYRSQKWKR